MLFEIAVHCRSIGDASYIKPLLGQVGFTELTKLGIVVDDQEVWLFNGHESSADENMMPKGVGVVLMRLIKLTD
jgi:hypothetical protein